MSRDYPERIEIIRTIEIHHKSTTPFEAVKRVEFLKDENGKEEWRRETLEICKDAKKICLKTEDFDEPDALLIAMRQLINSEIL